MGFLGKLFGSRETDETDDARELREYEEYYTPNSGVTESTYSELIVEDVFSIKDRGVVAVGTVTAGTFRVGDKVVIVSGSHETDSRIEALEKFRKMCPSVSEGEKAGVLLKGIEKNQVGRNDIIKKV